MSTKLMYRKKVKNKTNFRVNTNIVGESLERKIERMLANGEKLEAGNVQMIYTERSEGVAKGYDIRTDRWEVAVDAADKVSKGKIAKREVKVKPEEEGEAGSGKGDGEAKSRQGTEDKK